MRAPLASRESSKVPEDHLPVSTARRASSRARPRLCIASRAGQMRRHQKALLPVFALQVYVYNVCYSVCVCVCPMSLRREIKQNNNNSKVKTVIVMIHCS